MPDLDNIEGDQFLLLLSEALRSGPGSPQWHQAVRALRSGSHPEADEYALLCQAREHLESGKDFRSVRAGPAFTAKVLEGIQRESGPGAAGIFSANLIALIAAGAIIGVISVVAFMLMHGPEVRHDAADDLANTYFGNNLVEPAHFDSAIPAGWRTFGELPVTARKGLHPAAAVSTATAPAAYVSGGIVSTEAIDAGQPVALTVQLHVGKPSDSLVTQVFVSDQPADSSEAGPHELVWQYKEGAATVFVSGRTEPETQQPGKSDVTVRIRFNRDSAIVESDGKQLYAGAHQLDGQKARFVGVRFVRSDSGKADDAAVGSILMQKP